MKAILSLLAVLVLLATIAEAQLYVPGYQHRDRTRVRPHKRTYHDGTIKANYNRAAIFALGHSQVIPDAPDRYDRGQERMLDTLDWQHQGERHF